MHDLSNFFEINVHANVGRKTRKIIRKFLFVSNANFPGEMVCRRMAPLRTKRPK